MNPENERIVRLKKGDRLHGPVMYWMSRDQRVHDNRALLHAQALAIERSAPLIVVFCLTGDFPGATLRAYDFMIGGLKDVEAECRKLSIPFLLLRGDPGEQIPRAVTSYNVSVLVSDFDPLRIKRQWKEAVVSSIAIPFEEVDAHNIVPCRAASDKREYSAATIRRKIHAQLPVFFNDIPETVPHPYPYAGKVSSCDWHAVLESLGLDRSVKPVSGIEPGTAAAMQTLASFVDERLHRYAARANDPNADALSGLSPYIHFGQISSERIAREVMNARDAGDDNMESYLEQLIVRRELSDNFCFFEKNYDSFAAAPAWAKKTLDEHRDDSRDYVYSSGQFELAETHDPLWNAAQIELLNFGRIHSYMRMYWAKKILEWSESPEEAIDTAVRLNDRYALDGRDPNGYTGIMWSIAGLHDRAWSERPVFGKIRFMSYNGCRRKFDVDRYIARMEKRS